MARMRVLKIQKNLHRILMDYFLVKSARAYPGIISIKEIELSADLRRAVVYISVMGKPKDAQAARVKLEEDRMNIRRLVNQRLRMKYCPYFHFFVNHVALPPSGVEETLARLRHQREL